VDDWWSSNDVNHLAQNLRASFRNSFALDCHYDADTGTLSFGYKYPSPIPAYKLFSSSEPFVSAPFAAYAKLGDQDGINMPWFPKADATLLFWEIHRDTRDIPLRLQVKRSIGPNEFDVFVWAHSGEMVGCLFCSTRLIFFVALQKLTLFRTRVLGRSLRQMQLGRPLDGNLLC
jgi:hypothetical protein